MNTADDRSGNRQKIVISAILAGIIYSGYDRKMEEKATCRALASGQAITREKMPKFLGIFDGRVRITKGESIDGEIGFCWSAHQILVMQHMAKQAVLATCEQPCEDIPKRMVYDATADGRP